MRIRPILAAVLLLSSGARAQDPATDDPVAAIDRILADDWRSEGLEPSAPAGDAELARRLWLDVAGVVPAADEVRRFLDDPSPDKVDRLTDRLLASPEASRHQALLWQDVLLDPGEKAKELDGARLFAWLEERARTNAPWDRTVLALLGAEGHFPENFPAADLARVALDYEGVAIDAGPSPVEFIAQFGGKKRFESERAIGHSARVFLGVAIECAECHDHPWEKWTQADFRGLEAFFKRTTIRPLADPPTETKKNGKEKKLQVVEIVDEPARADGERARRAERLLSGTLPTEVVELDRRIADHEDVLASPDASGDDRERAERKLEKLRTKREKLMARHAKEARKILGDPARKKALELERVEPRYLGGNVVDASLAPDLRLRQDFARWVVSDADGRFSRATANRIWARYFGRGLVHPVDDLRESNPASIPALLDYLAGLLRRLDYDLAAFTRILLSTRAYRLSSAPSPTNRDDGVHYSRHVLVPLSPSQLAFSIARLRGGEESDALLSGLPGSLQGGKRTRGLLEADDTVDVSEYTGTIRRALYLMNGESTNRLPDGIDPWAGPSAVVEDLFLAILGRRPTDAEAFRFGNVVAATDPLPPGTRLREKGRKGPPPPRLAAIEDVAWALLNSTEFSYR